MSTLKHMIRPIQVFIASIALGMVFESNSTSLQPLSAQARKAFLLLRRCATELPSVWPFVHVGVGAESMSIIGRWMAATDGRRLAADGQGLWWRQRGLG
jgi:hypothetical protein